MEKTYYTSTTTTTNTTTTTTTTKMLDSKSFIGKEGLSFLDRVIHESSLAAPSSYAMTKAEFLDELRQRHNGFTVTQW